MKTLAFLAAISLAIALTARAGSRSSANYNLSADIVDSAGGAATSAAYANAASLGGIGAASTRSASYTAKAGYEGQVFVVTGLTVLAGLTNLNEGATLRLAATATLDDGSILIPATLNWSVVSGPINSISAGGVAMAARVYEDTAATVRGDYFGKFGTLVLTVLNVGNDDFGRYARDGLDDTWQGQYFGWDNPNAVPSADPDDDGQNNAYEYAAGTVPTSAASRFVLSIANVAGQPTQKLLTFSPRLTDRLYTVEFKTDLNPSVAFTPLTGAGQVDAGPTRMITDLNATESHKFYRVKISPPR